MAKQHAAYPGHIGAKHRQGIEACMEAMRDMAMGVRRDVKRGEDVFQGQAMGVFAHRGRIPGPLVGRIWMWCAGPDDPIGAMKLTRPLPKGGRHVRSGIGSVGASRTHPSSHRQVALVASGPVGQRYPGLVSVSSSFEQVHACG